MANKRKNSNTSKKKTTKKSNSTTKKVNSSKKTTSTATKKVNTPKKTTTTKKRTTPKSSSTGVKNTKSKVVKKDEIKIISGDVEKVEKEVKLPKLKTEQKEVSKNTNNPEIVMKTEEYTVLKKDPIRYKGKEKSAPVQGKKRIVKSNAKKVEKSKKSDFLKTINKLRRKIKIYGINSVIPIKYIVVGIIILALLIITPKIFSLFDKKSNLDLSSIPDRIDQLTTVSFDLDDVSGIISASDAYGSLKDYYEYDFKETIGLNPTYVNDYVIKINKSKKQAFIAIKPVDNYYDEVKNVIDAFLKDNEIKKYQYLEYQGYQIYIKSDNDAVVVSKIKQSQQRVFNIMKDLKKEDIEKELKVSDADYDEALVKTPMVVKSDTCGYVIFKPKNQSSKEKIKNLMEDYYKGLEAKWQNNEDNRTLVQNRYFEEYKGYLIYIVSHDNNLVLQLLKS